MWQQMRSSPLFYRAAITSPSTCCQDSRHSVTYSGGKGSTGNEKLRRWEHHLCLNLCHSCLATYTNKIPIRYPIISNGMSVISNSRPGTTILLSWSQIDTTAQNTTASRKGCFCPTQGRKNLTLLPSPGTQLNGQTSGRECRRHTNLPWCDSICYSPSQ